jgi:pimeloyl-ACP methyl ester carboxylesterase
VSVLIVTSPGFGFDAYRPMLQALVDDGVDVRVVEPGCAGDFQALADRVRAVIASQPAPPVVLAHGLGAALALAAGGPVDRYVLLAPILGVPRSAALDDALAAADLRDPVPWRGHDDLREVLLGGPVPTLGCFPAALQADLRRFRAAGELPLSLAEVEAPVWIGIGLLDELAPTEVVVPASRALPHRTVVRLGITHFDPQDYGHLALLTDPVPVRAAVRAAEGP